MSATVIVLQGLFELIGLAGFLSGYFLDMQRLMIAGGFLIIFDDIMQVSMGMLRPLYPVLLAVVLAIAFSEWYVGVLWAAAAFRIPGIPISLMRIYRPGKFSFKADAGDSQAEKSQG